MFVVAVNARPGRPERGFEPPTPGRNQIQPRSTAALRGKVVLVDLPNFDFSCELKRSSTSGKSTPSQKYIPARRPTWVVNPASNMSPQLHVDTGPMNHSRATFFDS